MKEKQQTVTNKKSVAEPLLTLSNADKLLLALSKKTEGKLIFIYSLIIRATAPNQYPLLTETEVSTFKNAGKADVYYATLKQVMKTQNQKIIESMSNILEANIKMFKENTK